MSTWLVPCPGCARHVHANTDCPFCRTHAAADTAPTVLHARLARAAMIGLGAAVALSGGCSPSAMPLYGAPAPDVVDAASQDSGGPAPAYGAVPIDAGSD
jgi:hypothetical protein